MTTCPSCGNQVNGEPYCPRCGAVQPQAGYQTQPIPTVGYQGPPGYPPGGYPPQPGYQVPPPNPGGGGGRNWLPWVAAASLLVSILTIGGILLLAGDDSDSTDAAATTSAEPEESESQATEPEPSQTSAPRPTPTPTPTVTVTKTPRPKPTPRATVTVTAEPPAGRGPASGENCGNDVYAGGTASCPFALNVADEYRSSGGSSYLPDVYSPVTGLYYDVTCDGVSPATCRTGRAIIYVY